MDQLDLITNSQEFISKRILERPKVTNFLAATVKNARLKNHLTLAQAVKNICSQSSWSKYENNYLTLPTEIVQSVCEGMGLNYQELIEVNRINNLPECIKFFLFDKEQEVKRMYEYTSTELFLSRDALIRAIYYLMTKKYDNFVVEIQSLDNVKNTLSDYELLVMLICTIEYYIQLNHFKEASKYLKIISMLSTDDKILKNLILQQRFIVSCNLKDYKTIHAYYTDLFKNTTGNFPIKKKILAKLLFYEAYPSDEAIGILDNLFYEIDDSLVKHYWYSRLIILIEMGNFYEVIKKIFSLKYTDIKFIALLGYAISKISINDRNNKDVEDYKKNFEELFKLVEYDQNDNLHIDFIKYVKLILNNDDDIDNEIDYLRKYIVPKMKLIQHRLYSPIYASRYTELLGKKSKYKDAYLFSIDNCELIKGLHYQQF